MNEPINNTINNLIMAHNLMSDIAGATVFTDGIRVDNTLFFRIAKSMYPVNKIGENLGYGYLTDDSITVRLYINEVKFYTVIYLSGGE